MKNILYIAFILITFLPIGTTNTSRNYNSITDNYLLFAAISESIEKEDTHSDYEEGINYTPLISTLLVSNIEAIDTRQQTFDDKVCKIFQPPR